MLLGWLVVGWMSDQIDHECNDRIQCVREKNKVAGMVRGVLGGVCGALEVEGSW
jgi:hypothetical protein